MAAARPTAADLGDRQAQHRQALALFPLLRSATKKALSTSTSTAQRLASAIIDGAEAMLKRSIEAPDLSAMAEASNASRDLLTELTVHWECVGQDDADVLWGLREGILASLVPVPVEESTAETSARGKASQVAELRETIEEVDSMVQRGCSAIAAMARLALKSLEHPDGHRDMDGLACLLHTIWDKAADVENDVNSSAEEVGCQYVDEAERRRWAAAAEVTMAIKAAGHE